MGQGPAGPSKAGTIYGDLKQRLISGHYRLGESILVQRLTAEFHSSRQPVMEALRWLAAEGFVEIMPQVGCRTVLPSPGDVSDFFLIFAAQEGLATGLAAERRDQADVDGLRDLVARLDALLGSTASEAEVLGRYTTANRELHGRIHRVTRSAQIARLGATLWDRADFYTRSRWATLLASHMLAAQREHRAIVDAIAADPTAARRLMEEHIRSFGNVVFRQFT